MEWMRKTQRCWLAKRQARKEANGRVGKKEERGERTKNEKAVPPAARKTTRRRKERRKKQQKCWYRRKKQNSLQSRHRQTRNFCATDANNQGTLSRDVPKCRDDSHGADRKDRGSSGANSSKGCDKVRDSSGDRQCNNSKFPNVPTAKSGDTSKTGVGTRTQTCDQRNHNCNDFSPDRCSNSLE